MLDPRGPRSASPRRRTPAAARGRAGAGAAGRELRRLGHGGAGAGDGEAPAARLGTDPDRYRRQPLAHAGQRRADRRLRRAPRRDRLPDHRHPRRRHPRRGAAGGLFPSLWEGQPALVHTGRRPTSPRCSRRTTRRGRAPAPGTRPRGAHRRRHQQIARPPRRWASAPAIPSPAPSAMCGCWARAPPAARSTTESARRRWCWRPGGSTRPGSATP